MALEYFLYSENYNNTLVDRSYTTFAPTPPGFDQILIDFLIPETQPLYLYKEDAGLIVLNDESTINQYLSDTAPPPAPEDPIESQVFTGYTATTRQEFTGYTDVIAPATYVNVSGDSMTGSLSTSGNFTAVGAVTGSSLSASVLTTTPVLQASTSVCAPQITGSTCITSPISCATTRMQAPVVCGGTCVTSPITVGSSCVCSPVVLGSSYICSPVISASTNMFGQKLYAQSCFCSLGNSVFDGSISGSTVDLSGTLCTAGSLFAAQSISGTSIYGSVSMLSPIVESISCLCSQGTTRLVGAATAASTLNVSGVTKFNTGICWVNPTTGGTLNDYGVKWDPISKQIRTIPSTGGTVNVYCYADKRVTENNSTIVDASYLSENWTLSAGYYEAEFNAVFGNTSANRCAVVCFVFDGNVVGSCNLMKTNDGTVQTTAYITQNNNLTGGTYNVSIVYHQIGGGVAQVHYGSMRVQRIGETT